MWGVARWQDGLTGQCDRFGDCSLFERLYPVVNIGNLWCLNSKPIKNIVGADCSWDFLRSQTWFAGYTVKSKLKEYSWSSVLIVVSDFLRPAFARKYYRPYLAVFRALIGFLPCSWDFLRSQTWFADYSVKSKLKECSWRSVSIVVSDFLRPAFARKYYRSYFDVFWALIGDMPCSRDFLRSQTWFARYLMKTKLKECSWSALLIVMSDFLRPAFPKKY